MSAVVLVVAAICVVVLVIWWRYSFRHKQRSRKATAVELADVADTGSVDSKEEQDTSVDNTCYMKLSSMLQPFIIIFSGQYYCMAPPIFGTFRLIQLSQILARKVILYLKCPFWHLCWSQSNVEEYTCVQAMLQVHNNGELNCFRNFHPVQNYQSFCSFKDNSCICSH